MRGEEEGVQGDHHAQSLTEPLVNLIDLVQTAKEVFHDTEPGRENHAPAHKRRGAQGCGLGAVLESVIKPVMIRPLADKPK